MALTPDEEKKLREEIRDGLKKRENIIRDTLSDKNTSRQEQMEMRMRQMIREEEEEKYFSERGFVKHKNRYGEIEWLPEEEAEKRKERRRSSSNKGKKSKKDKTSYLPWIINVAVFGLAGFLFLFLLRYNPIKSTVGVGSMEVKTDVPGARVFLNGVEKKQQTPADIKGLTAGGTYYVSVYKEGFSSWPPMQKIIPDNDKATPVKFELKNSSLLGNLKVGVNESDFKLFVDGIRIEHSSGKSLSLPAGYHVISVVKDGFIATPSYQRILVTPDSTSSVSFNLKTFDDIGYLEVSSNKSNGFIFIDNQFTGKRPNSGRIPLKPGLHEIRLCGNGIAALPQTERVRIESGNVSKLDFSQRTAEKGDTLDIVQAPAGAVVVLNGEVTPYVTPVTEILLSPGQHFLNLMADNKLLSSSAILVEAGKPDKNRIQLEF